MADIHNRQTRSYNMSQVKGRDTKPEILVRKLLFASGFRFRLHERKLPGKPDIVLPKYRTVIFVHGCFWHQHKGCKKASIPKSNTEFWGKKLFDNTERDKKVIIELQDLGYNVFVIYECQTSNLYFLKEMIRLINH